MDNLTGWLTTRQLAEYLNVKDRSVHEARKRREIPYIKMGRQFRYDLDAVLEALKVRPLPMVSSERREREAEAS